MTEEERRWLRLDPGPGGRYRPALSCECAGGKCSFFRAGPNDEIELFVWSEERDPLARRVELFSPAPISGGEGGSRVPRCDKKPPTYFRAKSIIPPFSPQSLDNRFFYRPAKTFTDIPVDQSVVIRETNCGPAVCS